MLELMKQYASLIKIVVVTIVIALLMSITWKAASDHYGKLIAATQAAQEEAVSKMQAQQLADAAAREKLIHEAGDQHAKDQLRINDLAAQLNGVRIHFPEGASGRSLPQGGISSGDQNGTCRMASARADEYMAEAQREIDRIGQRCAQLNIDAIQANKVR